MRRSHQMLAAALLLVATRLLVAAMRIPSAITDALDESAGRQPPSATPALPRSRERLERTKDRNRRTRRMDDRETALRELQALPNPSSDPWPFAHSKEAPRVTNQLLLGASAHPHVQARIQELQGADAADPSRAASTDVVHRIPGLTTLGLKMDTYWGHYRVLYLNEQHGSHRIANQALRKRKKDLQSDGKGGEDASSPAGHALAVPASHTPSSSASTASPKKPKLPDLNERLELPDLNM